MFETGLVRQQSLFQGMSKVPVGWCSLLGGWEIEIGSELCFGHQKSIESEGSIKLCISILAQMDVLINVHTVVFLEPEG